MPGAADRRLLIQPHSEVRKKEMNPSATFIFGLKRHCTGLAGGTFVPFCALMSVSISNSAVPVPSHRLPHSSVLLLLSLSLHRLPQGITQLKNLSVLGLNDMSLTDLPEDFGW